MKAKDLKSPYTWEERRPTIYDNILFVPPHFDKHGGIVFPETNLPLSVEYCSGNGEWIIGQAIKFPDRGWIAVEKQFERVRKIWSKSRNRNLKNLWIVCGEAQTYTRYYVPDSTFTEIFINFPDPWPKARHAKHRLVQGPFAQEMARAAAPGCKTAFVTDDAPYAAQMLEVMQKASDWDVQAQTVLDESHGPSFFDRLWRSKGRQIQELVCLKSI